VIPIHGNGDFLAHGSPRISAHPCQTGLQGLEEECRGLVGMHIIWPDMLVNVFCVAFRWIITQVLLTRLTIKLELLLCFSIHETEISYLHCTGSLLFDSVIDNANSSGIVNVDGCWRLWMPKFVES
jgi:hypothetical protein